MLQRRDATPPANLAGEAGTGVAAGMGAGIGPSNAEAAVDRGVARAWTATVATLLLVALAGLMLWPAPRIAFLFLTRQDLPALAVMTVFLMLLRKLRRPLPGLDRLVGDPKIRRLVVAALVAGILVLGTAGVRIVQFGYPLSMDEFMATFDAAIFSRGWLAAPVPEAWRPFLAALQPFYVATYADGAFWSSSYLPGNAALRAVFGLLGAEPAASAFWTALSVLLVYLLARKVWPERPAAALAAVVLFATSPQLILMATTPYAMASHLALNLLWLWLFLGTGARRHVGAAATSFVAVGLHQVVFHPLFAAPFVLQLWLERRFRLALFHTAAFAVIGLFWSLYPGVVAAWAGAPESSAGAPAAALSQTAFHLLAAFDFRNALIMAPDLLRYLAWQNPLTVPLALCAGAAAWRAGGTLRALLLGLLLTAFAMFVLMPFQTHGWGYRYLHGLLGNLALLAAFGTVRFAALLSHAESRVAASRFAAAAAFSLAVMLPAQSYQARRFVQPYAEAHKSISQRNVDVVLVDPTGLFYGIDLVRNDPFLQNRPKVMNLLAFDADTLRTLCGRFSVELFSTDDGLRHGIRRVVNGEPEFAAKAERLRSQLGEGPCVAGPLRLRRLTPSEGK